MTDEEVDLDALERRLKERGEAAYTASDEAEVASIRSAGRRVGRRLGWKVRTIVGPPSASGAVAVHVLVMESNPIHQQLIAERTRKASERAVRGVGIKPGDI